MLTIASLLRYTRCSIIRDNEYSRQLKEAKEEEEEEEDDDEEVEETEKNLALEDLRIQSISLLRGRPVCTRVFNAIRRRGRFAEHLEDHQFATRDSFMGVQ